MQTRQIILIVHDVRSAHNVGSIIRSADGLRVKTVFLTGYTPYPLKLGDKRLPHVAKRADQQIAKTALGAQKYLNWRYEADVFKLLKDLERRQFQIIALEQTPQAITLNEFKAAKKVALIVGSEVDGLDARILELINNHVNIPMLGSKESLNVSIAAAIALYSLRFKA